MTDSLDEPTETLEEGAPEQAEPPPPPPRAATLLEYLELPACKAEHLLSDIHQGTVQIEASDMKAAAELAFRRPEHLLRVQELARVGAAKTGLAQDVALRFALLAVQAQDHEFRNWSRDEPVPAAFQRLAHWARTRMSSEDKDIRQKGENTLAIGLLVLLAQRRLDPLLALRELASAYLSGGDPLTRDARNAKAIKTLLLKSRPKQLVNLARISRLQDADVAEARAKAEEERHRTLRVENARLRLQEEIEALKSTLSSSEQALKEARAQIEQLQGKLESTHRVGAHDLGDFRARYRRIFTEEIGPMAADAWDALDIDPPRIDFARDFLEQLRNRVDEETKWLNSPSA